MTQNKTIPEKIEELNKKLWEEGLSIEEDVKLSTLQEAQKMFLEEIDDRIKLIEEVKKDSDEIEKRICDSKLMELIKLKSKIGGKTR